MGRRARHIRPVPLAGLLVLCALHPGCAGGGTRTLVVQASAYNSLPGQTQGDPNVGAWGDVLKPGMRAIAVSRDLLALGLGHGVRVRIQGLPGEYVVLDKMAKRWRHKIDIYMGEDRNAARTWGVRELTIQWTPP